MARTPKEMTQDIASAFGKDVPELILLEPYLEAMIKKHREEAVQEYIDSQKNKQSEEYKPSHS